jgi:hypothetical protein
MSNSNNNNNNNDCDEREERRKASFALAHTSSTYILALSLLAAGCFAVIISTVTPMTAAIAQELDTTGQPGGGLEYSACTPTQIGGDGGGGSQNTTSNATTMGGGGGDANATAGNTTTTAGGGIGVSTSTSEVIDFIEQACIALEVGDTEGALIQLNLALDELRGGGGGGTQGNTTDTQSEITGGTATSG